MFEIVGFAVERGDQPVERFGALTERPLGAAIAAINQRHGLGQRPAMGVELNRELLVQLLEDDHRLVLAGDGMSALERAAEMKPDLILMDLSLPRMDGWEATRRLKAAPGLASIPVIVLSAHAMRGDEERARASGCDDFLTKPIDETLLFETIARHLDH